MGAPEKSIHWLRARVSEVLKTIQLPTTGEHGEPQFAAPPDDYVLVYHQAFDESVEKLYPAMWLLQPPQNLPEGRYRVVLLDKPEADGGKPVAEHVCTLRHRTGSDRGAVDEQRATALVIENMRTSSDELRRTIQEQRAEILRLEDELRRARDEIRDLRDTGPNDAQRAEVLGILKAMFTQEKKEPEKKSPAGEATREPAQLTPEAS